MEFSSMLNKVAVSLNGKGRQDLAEEVTKIATELDRQAAMQKCLMNLDASDDVVKEASELIATEYAELKMATDDYASANAEIAGATRAIEAAQMVIEAAKKRKKKWTKGIDLKKGRFTEYCKRNGFKGPCEECAKKALESPDKSVRGMAGFYKATQTFKKKKSKE